MSQRIEVPFVDLPPEVTVEVATHVVEVEVVGQPGPPGPTDHGLLSGKSDDDHPQYWNDARGDAKLAARTPKITVAPTAPSSPAVGDVWIDST